jgi:hypothetical protein
MGRNPEAELTDVPHCGKVRVMTAMADAFAKMQTLSEERASRVISLIEDLAELEARENAEDIADSDKAIEEYERTGEATPWEDLKKQLKL